MKLFLHLLLISILLTNWGCKKSNKKVIRSLKEQITDLNNKVSDNGAKSTTFSITFDSSTPLYYKSLFDIKPDKNDVIFVFLKDNLSYSILPQNVSDTLVLRYTIEQVGVLISLYKGEELFAPSKPQTFTFKVVSIPIDKV